MGTPCDPSRRPDLADLFLPVGVNLIRLLKFIGTRALPLAFFSLKSPLKLGLDNYRILFESIVIYLIKAGTQI